MPAKFRFSLARALEAHDFTAYGLALALITRGRRTAVSTVYRWVKGDTTPTAAVLCDIVEILECTPGDLFERVGDSPEEGVGDSPEGQEDVPGQTSFAD